MEFAGTVYICPYCRVQRTVILLLGVIMVLPFSKHWISSYLASVMGFMGAVVAVNQNFLKGRVRLKRATLYRPVSSLGRVTIDHPRSAVVHIDQGAHQRLLTGAAPNQAAQLSDIDP